MPGRTPKTQLTYPIEPRPIIYPVVSFSFLRAATANDSSVTAKMSKTLFSKANLFLPIDSKSPKIKMSDIHNERRHNDFDDSRLNGEHA